MVESGENGMFLGEYSHSLDSKGRIAVPAKFRGELGNTVYVTRFMDHSLMIYSEAGWQKELEALSKLDYNKKEVRKYVDFRVSKAFDVTFDAQGRILINSVLIDFAQLEKECVFTGAIDKVRLWSKKNWEAYDSQLTEEEIENISEGL